MDGGVGGVDACGSVGAGVGTVHACGTLKGSGAGGVSPAGVGPAMSGGGGASVALSHGAGGIGDGIGISWECNGGIEERRLESSRQRGD